MKQRIGYIDIAKGLCILLVMMVHIGIPEPLPNLYNVKVPLFFVLSGFFFREPDSMKGLLIKKLRTILIPFLFFYVVSYIIYYVMLLMSPSLGTLTKANGILDVFLQKEYFNGPLWFLPCLFWVYIINTMVFRYFQNNYLHALIIMMLGCLGYLLSQVHVNLPLTMDTALTAIPFFYVGYLLNKIEFFSVFKSKYVASILCVVAYLLVLICPDFKVSMSINRYDGNIAELYIACTLLTISIVELSKAVGGVRQLTYIGENTLLILCTHHLIYRPIKIIVVRFVNVSVEPYVTFVITIVVCLAQRILSVAGGSVKLS